MNFLDQNIIKGKMIDCHNKIYHMRKSVNIMGTPKVEKKVVLSDNIDKKLKRCIEVEKKNRKLYLDIDSKIKEYYCVIDQVKQEKKELRDITEKLDKKERELRLLEVQLNKKKDDGPDEIARLQNIYNLKAKAKEINKLK